MLPLLLVFSLLSGISDQPAPPAAYHVTVSAGSVDRVQSIVSFDLPPSLIGESLVLESPAGKQYPVQQYQEKGWFILPDLKANQTTTFLLRIGESETEGITQEAFRGDVAFSFKGNEIFKYNLNKTPLPRQGIDAVYKRGGYIHPVKTPSGLRITSDYPKSHPHHHGIWASWTQTRFQGRKPDFWNMAMKTGTVEPVATDTTWAGPVMGGFLSQHDYVDLSSKNPTTVLHESWETKVFAVNDPSNSYFLFELKIVQRSATENFLVLPEYRYGGLGFRGHESWEGVSHTHFLTSEGKGRLAGHGTRARWCHIGGDVQGLFAGVAILGHPDNFRAPQPMRIHPSEPFFNWAPTQAGGFSIRPDQPFESTYRFVVMDGQPDPQLIDRLWSDWANPVQVTISPQGE